MISIPSLEKHCAISKKRTFYSFRYLHKWIDNPYKKMGVNHRLERHSYNLTEEKTIKDYWDKKKGDGWGNKAVVEWLFHIALDNLETAFKRSFKAYKKNTYNYFAFGFDKSGYIHTDFEKVENKELKELD